MRTQAADPRAKVLCAAMLIQCFCNKVDQNMIKNQFLLPFQCGKDPCVIVWDPHTLQELRKLHHGYGYRGIQCVHFSTSGSKLVTVATDNSHSLFIWDLKRQEIILQRKTQPGAPPTVYGVIWSRFEPGRLVSYGQNHIKVLSNSYSRGFYLLYTFCLKYE